MANTAPMGRIAPAPKPSTGNTPHLDPVALHGEAINACAMATYYTRKGNHAGAARDMVIFNSGVALYTLGMVNDIAALNPLKFITSERAIATDSDKTNIKERFKQLSPHTDVRFI